MTELRIRRAAALSGLDDAQCVAGYFAGSAGERLPEGASFSFQHGWRNGMMDKGRLEIDEPARELVRDCVQTGYFKNLFARKEPA